MKRILIAALIAAAGSALAAPVAHQGADWVMLTEKPCPAEIAALAPEPARARLLAAETSIGGKPFKACWLFYEALSGALLIFEDGDNGLVPARDFHDEPGV